MKKMLTLAAFGVCLLALPGRSFAHSYDQNDDGSLLRLTAYVLHPVGVFLQDHVFRPFHRWVSSDEPLKVYVPFRKKPVFSSEKPRWYWFGHLPREGDRY